ncbi:MAG: hypothetical protein IPQ07_02065 [Myxococcales bacterium]|nr:hypothetical protein [Myxococcales bacterium]
MKAIAVVSWLALIVSSACGRSATPSAEPPPKVEPGSPTGSPTPRSGGAPSVTSPSAATGTLSPVQQLITAAELAPYWHTDRAGRLPIRIVENPNSTDRPSFEMFGAPVQWIAPAAATPGSAYVEVSFSLVDGILELSLRYRIEGVTARASFVPQGPAWVRNGPVRVAED